MGPCPLGGKCLTPSIIYKAEVKDQNSVTETYTGLTSRRFKDRFYEHRGSINHGDSDHSTTQSSHIWNLKDANKNFEVSWEILDRAQPFNPVNKKCNLCIKEKYFIIFQPQGSSLNQRNELFSTCRHRKKELLENF